MISIQFTLVQMPNLSEPVFLLTEPAQTMWFDKNLLVALPTGEHGSIMDEKMNLKGFLFALARSTGLTWSL